VAKEWSTIGVVEGEESEWLPFTDVLPDVLNTRSTAERMIGENRSATTDPSKASAWKAKLV
jgi:hypothetical protein